MQTGKWFRDTWPASTACALSARQLPTCMAIATGFLIGLESLMSGQKFFAVAQR
ncbi:hypothetical protein M003_30830 [Pseudomonas aeruginosa IGB83]|nr:hypothetical protein M003_30830 [Pseudomonas aeruginosa IGB83]